jgi:hypothetical protein
MHVAIDQPRQHEITANVERRRAVRGCSRAFTNSHDLPAGDADIDKPTIGKAAVGQKRLDLAPAPIPRTFAFVACYAFWSLAPTGSLVRPGR